jgi:predicted ATP-binding protein involved in virulence
MTQALHEQIAARVRDAEGMYSRLVLVVGPQGSGKTRALQALSVEKGWPRINLNIELAKALIDLTVKQRSVRVPGLLDDLLRRSGQDVVLLDNIEMLFSPELAQDPLKLLQSLSRSRTLVATWSGTYDGKHLMYYDAARMRLGED